jgi:hypothetical protein
MMRFETVLCVTTCALFSQPAAGQKPNTAKWKRRNALGGDPEWMGIHSR